MRALVIQPDGAAELADMLSETELRLTWLTGRVGGYPEAVNVPRRWTAYVDEDAKLKGSPLNVAATELGGWCRSPGCLGGRSVLAVVGRMPDRHRAGYGFGGMGAGRPLQGVESVGVTGFGAPVVASGRAFRRG
jgi:hypothetical protein